MPAGMSDAKARRNSKTKSNGKSRARAGLPAKAGKRRPHNIVKDASGNYVMAAFKEHEKVVPEPVRFYEQTHEVTGYHGKPQGAVLKDGLIKINKMQRNTKNNSDPFLFDRMRTHFVNGLLDL